MRTAEIAEDILFCVPSLLSPDDHHRAPVDLGKSPDDGRIICKSAVSVKLQEIGADPLNVIQSVGTVRMPCKLNSLPRSECSVSGLLHLFDFVFESGNLLGGVNMT